MDGIQGYICTMEFRQWKIHSMRNRTLLLQMRPDEPRRYTAVWRKPDRRGSPLVFRLYKVQKWAKRIYEDRSRDGGYP